MNKNIKTKFYNPKNHILNLQNEDYYYNLILLRNTIQSAVDKYFNILNAPKIDLFLISRGVSSPMGKGSDSVPVPIKFGNKDTYLVDSAQFGMEPLVQSRFKLVYCYLPSFRGEDPDDRHLNQFYHCEAEVRGGYVKCMKIAEELFKYIVKEVLKSSEEKKFKFENSNLESLNKIISTNFQVITFDEAVKLLEKYQLRHLVKSFPFGRVLTKEGEIQVGKLVGKSMYPVWVTKYDRDTVPFYQMPDPQNPKKVLNADLILPKINHGFGGEALGLGQRQNTSKGILDSMKKQSVKAKVDYKWYLELRDAGDYKITSGFGLGIERFIAWILGLNSIVDAAIYPVLKGEESPF